MADKTITDKQFLAEMVQMAKSDPDRFHDVLSLLWPFIVHKDFLADYCELPFLRTVSETRIDDLIRDFVRRSVAETEIEPQEVSRLSTIALFISSERTDYGYISEYQYDKQQMDYCAPYHYEAADVEDFFRHFSVKETTCRIIELLADGQREQLRQKLQAADGRTIQQAYRDRFPTITAPGSVHHVLAYLEEKRFGSRIDKDFDLSGLSPDEAE